MSAIINSARNVTSKYMKYSMSNYNILLGGIKEKSNTLFIKRDLRGGLRIPPKWRRENKFLPVPPPEQVVMHKDIVEQYKREEKQRKTNITCAKDSKVLQQNEDCSDLPVSGMANPYAKPPQRCILCEHNIELDYKNTRLLSQFISPHTGQIYGRAVTGLCIYMQKRIGILIIRSRAFGYMPDRYKNPRYIQDPKLFDPFARKH